MQQEFHRWVLRMVRRREWVAGVSVYLSVLPLGRSRLISFLIQRGWALTPSSRLSWLFSCPHWLTTVVGLGWTWASLVAQPVKNPPAMQEPWAQSLDRENLLEEEMVTHSSILAQTIPWTEEPGGLQSMGSQRVKHDWATNTFTLGWTKDQGWAQEGNHAKFSRTVG